MPKIRRIPPSIVVCAVIAAYLGMAGAAAARDITQQIRAETDVEQQVAQACRTHCVGNASQGTLKYFRVNGIGNGRYNVQAMAHMRNRQKALGNMVLYDHTVGVIADGELKKSTCELVVTGVRVTNDFQGIFADLLRQNPNVVGSRHIVQNCKKYL